jgi:hypothetical protein
MPQSLQAVNRGGNNCLSADAAVVAAANDGTGTDAEVANVTAAEPDGLPKKTTVNNMQVPLCCGAGRGEDSTDAPRGRRP